MARPREDEVIVREHVWLYESDMDWIKKHFGLNIGKSKAIRQMVRVMRKQIEGKALAHAQHPKVEDILDNEETKTQAPSITPTPEVII